MTTFPNFLDHYATKVLGASAQVENPHHRALLETYDEVRQREAWLLAAMLAPHPHGGPEGEHACTGLLLDRLAVGKELAALLSTTCCCPDEEETGRKDTSSCSPACEPDTDEGEQGDEDSAPWRGCRRH
ncbi:MULTISPECIES: hypothetical protein [unclassified Streptomyces]|uniref:hypothetical protein n=1 Tax=unclassified Streptomyces TaxID=2593676 RepID=UPI0029663A36|nr:hypothetical protein [Streptomyces sp. SJL17-1]